MVQGLYTPFNFFDIKYGVGPQGKEKCSSQCFLNGILTFPLTTNVCSGSLHIRYPISFWWMGIYGINLVIGKNMCPRQVMFRRTDGRIKWRTDDIFNFRLFSVISLQGYPLHRAYTYTILVLCVYMINCVFSTHEGFVLLHNGKRICMYFSFWNFYNCIIQTNLSSKINTIFMPIFLLKQNT